MSVKLKPLAEQTIVITGATSGIGLTTACRAAARGAKVVLVARNEDALREIRDGILARGGRADYVVADVGDKEDMIRVGAEAERHFGRFDTWVNNAGIGVYAKLEELSDEDHERLFRTNYWGVVYGSRVALQALKRHGGALINMGSIASEMPSPMLGAYTATKHAVKGFTDSLRLELLHEGAPVSVTLIQPSGIDTPFGEHARNYMDEASQVPPPVYAPEVVADAILHAAEHPTRNLVVGGVGRAMIAASRVVPSLADRLFAWSFFKTARQAGRPPRDTPKNLHQPGEDGSRHGDQGHQFGSSLYTAARMHPAATLGALAAGAALVGMIASGRVQPANAAHRLQRALEHDRAA
ncbi:SDR family oxidoreductase [Falsiroseomonas sp.]|uniref:SDR family oxidoreductase n=1 Tax=Falsiroseomonas sp. TaxID=2870721 RepID=UPI003564B6D7